MQTLFQPARRARNGTWRLASLFDLLLPQDCQLCGAPARLALLCRGCLKDLPRLRPDAVCPQCAMPTPGGTICGTCLRHPPHFDRTHAALVYAFPADRLIQALKYQTRLPIAALLATLMLESQVADTEITSAHGLLIPMPLHPARLATRGYNQAVEMSRHIARATGRPLLAAGISRRRDTPPQAGLALPRRRANLRGAFACDIDLSGRTVTIIDDVMTSGFSLNELARTLKRAGAARVENWVAARTPMEHSLHV